MAKATKKEMWTIVLGLVGDNEDLSNFVNKEIETLSKKKESKKVAEKKAANDILQCVIVKFFEQDNTPRTVTELIRMIPALNDLTNQKVSAQIKQLVDLEILNKHIDKRVSKFNLAEVPVILEEDADSTDLADTDEVDTEE